ncbi:MAG: ATP-grasp domain-containing protein [Alphaproteobacteria bacterium]|nr:ATP-grasp domain-containing protein [Alphaproteobacteria bacterium]
MNTQNNIDRNILIGSAGTASAFATIQAIRRNLDTNCYIISTDINPPHLVTSSLLSDKHIQVNKSNNPKFENEILKIINEHNIDTYIPFIDLEVLIASKLYKNNMLKENVCLQVKDPHIAAICHSKLESYYFLNSLGIKTPKIFLESTPDLPNSILKKPLSGFGSKIDIIDKADYEKNFEQAKNDFIFQEICSLPEITVDVSYSKKFNHFKYICRERIEIKSGVCTKARIFFDNKLEEIALQLAKNLNLHSFCFQVMRLNDDWAVTDMNPRLGAGTPLSYAYGYDFFNAMLYILWDKNPNNLFSNNKSERFVTRQYVEYLM